MNREGEVLPPERKPNAPLLVTAELPADVLTGRTACAARTILPNGTAFAPTSLCFMPFRHAWRPNCCRSSGRSPAQAGRKRRSPA